jgi:phage tail sheath protein FI
VVAAAEAAVSAAATSRRPVAAAGRPVLLDGWERFKDSFGDIQDGNHLLAHAVYGFFNNGGGRCWVTRAAEALSAVSVRDALAGLATHEDIALVAVPGATDPDIQGVVIDHCENTANRFAILDAVAGAGDGVPDSATLLKVSHSSYGALYFPWLRVPGELPGSEEEVAPSGHVAGVYARVDQERGVHKAPANEVLRGVTGVSTPVSRIAQGALNVAGVNVIRPFGTSMTIWGARTLAKAQPEYITSRRMLIYLRGSIEAGLQWVVFEPNAMPLWARIERNVRAFLTTVWATGALFGATPQEAFYVRCNSDTNKPEDIDLGRVTTEVGVALVKPAEFVVFRISQLSGAGQ